MTKAGRLSIEFEEFKADIEARLTALENGSVKEHKSEPKKAQKKDKNIIVDTKGNDIIATEE